MSRCQPLLVGILCFAAMVLAAESQCCFPDKMARKFKGTITRAGTYSKDNSKFATQQAISGLFQVDFRSGQAYAEYNIMDVKIGAPSDRTAVESRRIFSDMTTGLVLDVTYSGSEKVSTDEFSGLVLQKNGECRYGQRTEWERGMTRENMRLSQCVFDDLELAKLAGRRTPQTKLYEVYLPQIIGEADMEIEIGDDPCIPHSIYFVRMLYMTAFRERMQTEIDFVEITDEVVADYSKPDGCVHTPNFMQLEPPTMFRDALVREMNRRD